MTKTIALILVTLFSVACGGEPFGATEFDAAGGEGPVTVAGASDVAGSPAAGTAGSSSGGALSVGGSGAGGSSAGTVGSVTGGSATGGTGSVPVTCEFDVEQLTAALPKSLTWSNYMHTDADKCVTCRDSPCADINVISWGVPQVMEDGRLQYLPNTDHPMVSMNFGTNDGMCTSEVSCGVKFANPQLLITVTKDAGGWMVSAVESLVTMIGNQCTSGTGASTFPMGTDFDQEIESAIHGLKVPCG